MKRIGLMLVALFVVHPAFGETPAPAPTAEPVSLTSLKVSEIPLQDVNDVLWNEAPAGKVKLFAQNIIAPHIDHTSIEEIRVRSMHDDEWIAFLLEWDDPTRNASLDVDKFTDQVAIQLPLNTRAAPSIMMGQKGERVHIIHWKAIWQDDIEKGYQDVQDLHPNYWVDMYYFTDQPSYAEGEFPQEPHVKHFKTPEAVNYMAGAYARNPVSMLDRHQPVEEAMAEGYGTFTTQPKQNARGWGRWEDGKWKVIIARPIVSDDANDAPLGEKTSVAFAVWNGEFKNVGSRKHFTLWTALTITP